MQQNNYEVLIGKTILEAQFLLKDYKLEKIQAVGYECILKKYFFGLVKKRLFLYCTDNTDNRVRDIYVTTY
ncbi:hypothetical protein ACM39_08680 [Chryseobacterium sp. FH2]|uniref:hypothetical protein n=1 Tax=Chryseobacterium sp. FH2 TaxID=1674291 RepID=UPI00065AAA74|nr:hypothetical protein [Chryseobacterium sp. FH2]KMQ68566.1 hypothetical protein ACM39_08680 [Chryseobacterium sp. FH2]